MSFKRLIICCDGTWQDMNKTYPTNVAKMYKVINTANQHDQHIFYDPGVGTSNSIAKWFGGIFGWGLNKNIRDCYSFLCENYYPGNHIYLFGFSRGAYTVRSLSGLLYQCGIVKTNRKKDINKAMKIYRDHTIHPDHQKAVKFRKKYSFRNPETGDRPNISFLGCWDTVGSLGVPDLTPRFSLNKKINKKYQFHDVKLSEIILNASHAVALDERRKVFNVTPMELSTQAKNNSTKLNQMWFIGDHGCIGGGEKEKEPLSDISFHWMVQEILNLPSAQKLDLNVINIPVIDQSNYLATYDSTISNLYKKLGTLTRSIVTERDMLHWSVKKRLLEDDSYILRNKGKIIKKIVSEKTQKFEFAEASF